MKILASLAVVALFAAPAADAQRRSDQERAFEARRDGTILSPRAIEARVLPAMKDYQYLGFDLDFGAAIYTLKFLRDGMVVWVDVDGRSGQVLRRTGR